jgi:hypothetical protein
MHIATGKLKVAYLKQDYTQELDVVGGKSPYTWTLARFQQLPLNETETPGSVVMGDFPADFGIAIEDGNTDYLKGVPKVAGLYALELHVSDAAGSEDATTLLLDITYTDPIAITTTSLPDAFIAHDYQAKLSHNRGMESTGVQFSIPCIEQATAADMFACAPTDQTQNLPIGLTLGPDGTITGTPIDMPGVADKTYSFLVKVVDDAGRQDVRSLSIRLRPAIGTASGCSATDFGPMVLLALVAIRRRKPVLSGARRAESNGGRP